MPHHSSLEVSARIDHWWSIAKARHPGRSVRTDGEGRPVPDRPAGRGCRARQLSGDRRRRAGDCRENRAVGAGERVRRAADDGAVLHRGLCRSRTQRATWLPRIAAGEVCTAIAISEPGAGAHPKHLKTTAESRGAGFVLRGRKAWVTNGPVADLFLVLAVVAVEDGRKRYGLFMVPKETAGLVDKADEGAGHAVAGDALRAGTRWLRGAGVGADRRLARRLSGDGLAVSRCRGHRRNGECCGVAELAAREGRRADRAHAKRMPCGSAASRVWCRWCRRRAGWRWRRSMARERMFRRA